jgi:ComF family protein
MNMLRCLIDGLVEIIYPKTCLVCKNKILKTSFNTQAVGNYRKQNLTLDNFVCGQCREKIKRNLPPFCFYCGRHLETNKFIKNICLDCIKKSLYFDRAFSPYIYDGVIKELIHKFKYENKDYLGTLLSDLMIEFINEYNLPLEFMDLIIPIPLHKTKLREREFNQAEILGDFIARRFNKLTLNNCLLRHRQTKTQTELEKSKRLINVKDSFLVNQEDRVKNKNILLIDDVLTTAATCSEAAYTLKKAGANIIFVLTLAS